MIQEAVFYVFSTLAILAALWVVVSKNPVLSVLAMVFSFVCMSAVWLLLESEFLAISLILVYVGAVMVLFLFVVMMLDVNIPKIKHSFVVGLPVAVLVAGSFLGIFLYVIGSAGFDAVPIPAPKPEDYSNVKALGQHLFTEFLLPFELAGCILLVAIVAAISLTFRPSRRTKRQNIADQVRTRKEDRLKVVKMESNSNWKEQSS